MTLQSNTDEIRQIEADAAPSRFARGWRCLGLANDFGDGQPHAVHAFGQRLVLFRTGDGKINALAGYRFDRRRSPTWRLGSRRREG